MNTDQLIATGLTPPQAEAYLALLQHGSVSPPELASELNLSRTNAYKVLDKLTELGLAKRHEQNKKFVYYADNPLGLTNLVAEQRNIATAREAAVKRVMGSLLTTYQQHAKQPDIDVVTGHEAVVRAYKTQIGLQQPIYFMRSRADIASMGFDTMHEIRVMPAHYGQNRFGITPDMITGPVNPDGDKRSKLERTWVKQEDYTAPVEWSVSGATLLIVLFGEQPHAITITNSLVAESFLQMWHIMDTCLRAMPYYHTLPRTQSGKDK